MWAKNKFFGGGGGGLKNVGFIFSACWHLYRLKASSPDPLHKGTKYIQHNKSEQIVLL